MKHTIQVNGIKIYAYHGCLPEEAKIGGNYTVYVSITTDFSKAFSTDALEDTIDYVAINKIVCEEMSVRSKLIEHVGNRISQSLRREIKGLTTSKVKIVKHTPPIGGNVEDVAIIIEDN